MIEAIDGRLLTKPPGGNIKIKDAENALKEIPAGHEIHDAISRGLPSGDTKSFFDKFKDFDYDTVEIVTGMAGDKYVTTLSVRERAERDPLELEIKFNYIRKVIKH